MAVDKEHYLIEIPNINNSPYVIVPVVLNNRTYYFEYKWCIREQVTCISIYILNNNIKTFLLRNMGLTIYNDVAKYIHDAVNWTGELYLKPKSLSTTWTYNQQNISTDYELSYVPV